MAAAAAFPAGHDLAGAYAEAELERSERRFVLEAFAQRLGGGERALGIVAVRARQAEDRHHRIADELLERAAMRLDHLAGHGVIARQDGPHILGVERFAERSGAGDVGEQDRDDATFVGHGDSDREMPRDAEFTRREPGRHGCVRSQTAASYKRNKKSGCSHSVCFGATRPAGLGRERQHGPGGCRRSTKVRGSSCRPPSSDRGRRVTASRKSTDQSWRSDTEVRRCNHVSRQFPCTEKCRASLKRSPVVRGRTT